MTTPDQSNAGSVGYNIPANTNSLNAQSPSTLKVIDLRNPNIRKLVMDSLNDIIVERKKSRHSNNLNYHNIL